MTKEKGFGNDKATNEWLDGLKDSTRKSYKTLWRDFLEYTRMTGDQILQSRKQDKEYNWEKKVITFRHWLETEKKQSEHTTKTAVGGVRGFFAYHRVPLQFRRLEGKGLSEARRKTEDYYFNLEDLKKMIDVGDLTEKYVIVAGKSFGLRAGDFIRLTRGDLEPYIDRETPISIGEISTKKESVRAYPFIDSDAKPIIKLMIQEMDRKGRTNPSDRILPWKSQIELTNALQRTAKKAGINTGNKIVRFHCLRKFLTDRLSRVMSESKWKQIVGKEIDEKAYVSTESLREDYARAMAETTISKTTSEQEIDLRAKKQTLIMWATKMLGMKENEIKTIFRERKVKTTKEEVQVLEELTEKKKTMTNGGCSDGQHCQRVVNEEQLEGLLNQGWRVVTALPSGKVVLER